MQGRKNITWVIVSIVAGLSAGILARIALVESPGNKPAENPRSTVVVKADPETKSTLLPDAKAAADELDSTTGPPRMGEVLASRGLDRYVSLALYLASATGDDLQMLIEAWEADGTLSLHFYDMIFLRWTEIDPEGAIAFTKRKGQWKSASNWAWAKIDPEAAFAAALEGKVNSSGVLRAIAQTNPDKALELLRLHPEFAGFNVHQGIVQGLSKKDLKRAIEYAGLHGIDLGEISWNKWAQADPKETAKVASGIEDPRARANAIAEVLPRLMDVDPAQARKLAQSLPSGQLQANAALEVALHLARDDSAAAEAWIDSFDSPGVKRLARAGLAVELAKHDPERALDLLDLDDLSMTAEVIYSYEDGSATYATPWGADDEGFSTPEAYENLSRLRPRATVEHIFEKTLAEQDTLGQDPFAAAGDPFSSDLSFGESTPLHRAMRQWTKVDPAAASTWLSGQEDGVARSIAVNALVDGMLVDTDPDFASALDWAAHGPNTSSYKNVFARWYHHDPSSALNSLESLSANMPEEQHHEILVYLVDTLGIDIAP